MRILSRTVRNNAAAGGLLWGRCYPLQQRGQYDEPGHARFLENLHRIGLAAVSAARATQYSACAPSRYQSFIPKSGTLHEVSHTGSDRSNLAGKLVAWDDRKWAGTAGLCRPRRCPFKFGRSHSRRVHADEQFPFSGPGVMVLPRKQAPRDRHGSEVGSRSWRISQSSQLNEVFHEQ